MMLQCIISVLFPHMFISDDDYHWVCEVVITFANEWMQKLYIDNNDS